METTNNPSIDNQTEEQGTMTTETMTAVQQLAAQVRSYFVRDTRNDGTKYYHATDAAPEWVTEMIHAAHGDMLPDDFVYETIVDALDELSVVDDPDDANLDADIYTADLTGWLHSRVDRYSWVDEAIEEINGGEWPNGGLVEALQLGQWYEKSGILNTVRSALLDRIVITSGEDEEVDSE